MKAKLYIDVLCPKCNRIMRRMPTGLFIHCESEGCELEGQSFYSPTLELVPVRDVKLTISVKDFA